MSIFTRAKQLAEMGFFIFPLKKNGKTPAIKKFTETASCNPQNLEVFLKDGCNIGIATTRHRSGALLVIDVDNKENKPGLKTFENLKKEGFDFPETFMQKTPTGGLHLVYLVKEPVGQTVNLWPGIDTRSKGGYIVGAGSLIGGKPYLMKPSKIAWAPEWLIKKASEKKVEARISQEPKKKISQKGAKARGLDYLLNQAPVAIEGDGGDQTTFIVASKLKDIGLTEKNALQLMLGSWNENCQPPWSPSELQQKVKNAYSYGQNSPGSDSPENDFEPVSDDIEGPIEKLNKEFSFVVLGGKSAILRHKADGDVDYMTVQAFHDLLKSDTIQTGNGKRKQLSELWFSSPKRATFNSVELIPGKPAPAGVYNLWRGFACEPVDFEKATPVMRNAVSMFKEHGLNNVCLGNQELWTWLFGYFAHLIQKPWEKPLTAIVLKGQKGVGKNAFIDSIGNLFNGHYLLTGQRRYLTSNFNKHLANLLLFVLDEASWGGDKQAEGILKDLITGHTHLIEQKGREMYQVPNLVRICILGNEEWVVPATEDERRFAIFNIGNDRRRDTVFFKKMRQGLQKGGNRLLLHELQSFDLKKVDINTAPETEGLLDQKIESLTPLHAWWYSCLKDGVVLNLEFAGEEWPESVGRDQLRNAFTQYAKGRGIRSWLPSAATFGRELLKCAPDVQTSRVRSGTNRVRAYKLPALALAREQFEAFIGHKIEWEPDDESANVIDIFS